jgi:ABC-type nitrate/sulfonate/bicarbonate transport system substrate-binding protein
MGKGLSARQTRSVLVLCIAPLACLGCSDTRLEPLRLGSQALETTLPIEVAQQGRLFEANGLDVAMSQYDTGLAALNALIEGKDDAAAGVSDYVVTTKVLAGDDLKAVACIDKVDFIFLVARKDRGIHAVHDLAGKKIGVLPSTAQEFYVSRFLDMNGVGMEKVTMVNPGTLSDGVGLIADGGIDALVTVDPYLGEARAALGENAVVWPAQGSQPVFLLVVCRSQWIPGHEATVVKLLQSLRKAEERILWHPSDAKKTAQNMMGVSKDQVEAFWQRNEYSLSLERALLAAMEDEARWLIASGLEKAAEIPDFTDSMYVEGMRRVFPEGISVIY